MTSRLRLGVVGIVVLSLFAALLARLWYLQVLAAPTFRVAATANEVRLVYDEAPRGRILDRNGKVLVDNRVAQAITGGSNAHSQQVQSATRSLKQRRAIQKIGMQVSAEKILLMASNTTAAVRE